MKLNRNEEEAVGVRASVWIAQWGSFDNDVFISFCTINHERDCIHQVFMLNSFYRKSVGKLLVEREMQESKQKYSLGSVQNFSI